MSKPTLTLNGFNFRELFSHQGLLKLDQQFLHYLKQQDNTLHTALLLYREQNQNLSGLALSELLLALAPLLENFVIDLFAIATETEILKAKTLAHNPVAAFKNLIVLRRAKKLLLKLNTLPDFLELNAWLEQELLQAPVQSQDKELAIALLAQQYLQTPEHYAQQLDNLSFWCTHALLTPEAQAKVKHWTSFRLPERLDYAHLIPCQAQPDDKFQRLSSAEQSFRLRDGFKLTDARMNAREAQDEVNYCIYCHDHEGDFCSKGFPVKKNAPSLGFKKNPLDVTLSGCPLEEKISEMHSLRRDGLTIAALAMIMVDNPMCPATGHRICNDCMKACIYQKQEPVNIPQVETRILTDVLSLPWGVEIYDLFTRWNPLRQSQWCMKPYNGLKIMIAGMGPAGFTLAHHLLLEGFAIVGFDGLKIEPLAEKYLHEAIYHFNDIKEELDSRVMAGFGGVAEYGITARWDKNFLKLIYISLMRRPYFQVFGSTRFGGTITVEEAWQLGFDHFAIAVGAGLPKALAIPGSLAPGMRQANDFLMALQLGNAAKKESLTNIQVRLPAVIIGGGLTGVDTATEVQAYYIAQVEKIVTRYEVLTQHLSEQAILKQLDMASVEILEEFLLHGRAVRNERQRAKEANEKPNFIKLIRQWGGVTIVYRRRMQESPAYINNHEELKEALREGIYYLETLEPHAVELNQHGHVETLICHKRIYQTDTDWQTSLESIKLPARAIFVATGTQPNIAYEFEHRGTFTRLGLQYQHYEDENGELIIAKGTEHCKEVDFGAFTSYKKDDYRVSLVGDTHPVFHGNVVKAIASGLRTYPKILAILHHKLTQTGDEKEYQSFKQQMQTLFTSQVSDVKRCSENIIELTIKSPLAAKHCEPGKFYRLQNFETYAPRIQNTLLQTEPLALIALKADTEQGTLTFMVIEKGASSKICASFKVGEPVALMGPTGARAKVAHEHETVLIIGNQLGLAFLHSYGKALRQAGNRVLYLAHLKQQNELYQRDWVEESADSIIWTTQAGAIISTERAQDYSAQGDILDILLRYAEGKLDPMRNKPEIPLQDVDRIYLISDNATLRRFQEARKTLLKPFLVKDPRVFGSVYSTMQCMLKGVCAQCLQWQIDPETGQRTKAVFACSWPDQPLELIDFQNVEERLAQNRLQETLSQLWLDYLFSHPEAPSRV